MGTGPLKDRVLLEEIVRALVDAPEQVRVEEAVREQESHFTVHVCPSDRRHLIGTKGRMVMLLRSLLGAVGARQGRKNFIELDESAAEREAHLAQRHGAAR